MLDWLTADDAVSVCLIELRMMQLHFGLLMRTKIGVYLRSELGAGSNIDQFSLDWIVLTARLRLRLNYGVSTIVKDWILVANHLLLAIWNDSIHLLSSLTPLIHCRSLIVGRILIDVVRHDHWRCSDQLLHLRLVELHLLRFLHHLSISFQRLLHLLHRHLHRFLHLLLHRLLHLFRHLHWHLLFDWSVNLLHLMLDWMLNWMLDCIVDRLLLVLHRRSRWLMLVLEDRLMLLDSSLIHRLLSGEVRSIVERNLLLIGLSFVAFGEALRVWLLKLMRKIIMILRLCMMMMLLESFLD